MACVSGYFSVGEKVERGCGEGGWEGLRIPPGLQWGHCGPQDGDALSGVGPAGITGDDGRAPFPPADGLWSRVCWVCTTGCSGAWGGQSSGWIQGKLRVGLQGDAGESSLPPPAVSAWLGSWLWRW